uniref:Uncharacterized protein n=1 Tax=Anguilla anguilla TaxID=7936 RepID=A0A0E9QDF1_ANGAN
MCVVQILSMPSVLINGKNFVKTSIYQKIVMLLPQKDNKLGEATSQTWKVLLKSCRSSSAHNVGMG